MNPGSLPTHLAAACTFALLAAGSPGGARSQEPPGDCLLGHAEEHYDYLSTERRARQRIKTFEDIHLNANVRSLTSGQTGSIGADLHFVLTRVPNHHTALDAMVRLGFKEGLEKPKGASFSVECYLYKAAAFSPDDGVVRLIYGTYLARADQDGAALRQLQEANRLLPESGNVHYNLGLMYFDRKDYARAREHALQAYALGFPLPGLKRKLVQVGQWEQ